MTPKPTSNRLVPEMPDKFPSRTRFKSEKSSSNGKSESLVQKTFTEQGNVKGKAFLQNTEQTETHGLT